jgi:hypothetical protein
MVVHNYNPYYMEGTGSRVQSEAIPGQKFRTYMKKKSKSKRDCVVTQKKKVLGVDLVWHPT